jgi:hypothetical protein
MVRVEKDLPYFLANRAPPWFSGYFTGDAFLGEIFFQALNLSGLATPLYTFESNKERQFYYPPNESKSLAGCSKTPICGAIRPHHHLGGVAKSRSLFVATPPLILALLDEEN